MKLFNKLLLALLLIPTVSYAQDNISQSTGIIGNGRLLGAQTFDGQSTVGILGIDSDGNTSLEAMAGSSVKLPATLVGGDIIPDSVSAYDVGSSAYPFSTVVTDAIQGGSTAFTMTGRGPEGITTIAAASSVASSAGAGLILYGDTAAGAPGYVILSTGDDAAANMRLRTVDEIQFQTHGGSNLWSINQSGNFLFSSSSAVIASTSADLADDDILSLSGGGAAGVSRGAHITLRGNEASSGGHAYIITGDKSGADVNFQSIDDFRFLDNAGSNILLTIDESGNIAKGITGQLTIGTHDSSASDLHLFTPHDDSEIILTSENVRRQPVASSFGYGQKITSTGQYDLVSASGPNVYSSFTIPEGAMNVICTARVTTTITGATSWDLGLETDDVNLYGGTFALAAGTEVDAADYSASPQALPPLSAGQRVRITSNGGSFTAGAIRLYCWYDVLTAPGS